MVIQQTASAASCPGSTWAENIAYVSTTVMRKTTPGSNLNWRKASGGGKSRALRRNVAVSGPRKTSRPRPPPAAPADQPLRSAHRTCLNGRGNQAVLPSPHPLVAGRVNQISGSKGYRVISVYLTHPDTPAQRKDRVNTQ